MTVIRNKRLISVLLAVTLLSSVLLLARPAETVQAAETAIPVTHVMLNLGKDPSSYNVTWTEGNPAGSTLTYSPTSELKNGAFPASAKTVSASKEAYYGYSGTYTCRAKMSGLKPNTEYTYRVGSDSAGWQGPYTVTTSDFDDGSFGFILSGDPQLGTGGSARTQASYWEASLENIKNWAGGNIEFLLSAGDHINSHDLPDEFNCYAYPSWLRSLPQINTSGNHDNGSDCVSYNFTFDDVDQTTTSESGKYGGDYWTAYDGVLFINLNSNTHSYAKHRAFMERAIAEYTAQYGEPYWKIAYYHESSYSAAEGRFNSTSTRDQLVPILSELGIDAVLMGHDHIHTRTYMMSGLTPVTDPDRYKAVGGDAYGSIYNPEDGEVFFLTANSGSGSKFYEMYTGALPFTAFKNQENVPNITKVNVTKDCLTFRTYRTGVNSEPGDALDFFAIHRTDVLSEDVYKPSLEVPEETLLYSDDPVDLLDGVYAYDNKDGDLKDSIKTEGKIDYNGESVIKYTVTDKAGNTATAERRYRAVNLTDAVTKDSLWKYTDDGVLPFDPMTGENTDWTKAGYDISEWKEGFSSFGFSGEADGKFNGKEIRTKIEQYGSDESEFAGMNVANYFFRTEFDLDNPESVNYIEMKMYYDDGMDIYINGVRIDSINTIDLLGRTFGYCANPSSIDSLNLSLTDQAVIKSLNLKKTGNILAIELYQCSEDSDDVFLGVESVKIGRYSVGLPFTDVPENAWFYKDVSRAFSTGLMVGMSETIFSPNTSFTRAMSWAVLSRISGAVTDDEGHEWYYGERLWAMENGVSDGTFPNKPATREQIVTMLYNLSGKPAVSGSLNSFSDKGKVSKWASDALIWAVNNKIIFGRGNNLLAPTATATRAEVCALVLRYLDARG